MGGGGSKAIYKLYKKNRWFGPGERIVGKKRDPRIQDPVIFSGKIRKNRKKFGKIEKIRKNTFFPKNLGKIQKNSEKYFEKFGKILKKNLKIRKNRKNSEKYF